MHRTVIPVGLAIGALSWGIVALVSDRFEPFDSSVGFYWGQFFLSIFAVYFGYKNGLKILFVYLFSAYTGMNAYAFIFGVSEARGWALLGLVTTLILLVYPLFFGVMGKLASFVQSKYNKSLKQDK